MKQTFVSSAMLQVPHGPHSNSSNYSSSGIADNLAMSSSGIAENLVMICDLYALSDFDFQPREWISEYCDS